jgi:hypothetical protein
MFLEDAQAALAIASCQHLGVGSPYLKTERNGVSDIRVVIDDQGFHFVPLPSCDSRSLCSARATLTH